MRESQPQRQRWTARLFPERTVSVRHDGAVHGFHLSTATQLRLCLLAIFVTVWSVAATTLLVTSGLESLDEREANQRVIRAFEARVERLAAENDGLGAALIEAERHAASLQRAVAARHEAMLDAQTTATSLRRALDTANARLDRVLGERDALLETAASAAGRRAETRQSLDAAMADKADLANVLQHVTRALDAANADRDAAVAEATILAERLAEADAAAVARDLVHARLIDQLRDAASRSVGPLEAFLADVGIDPERVASRGGMGGPFIPAPDMLAGLDDGAEAEVASLLSSLDRVAKLRAAARALPVARPVERMRITSGFGPRRDPINRRRSIHEGIDIAGRIGTPILAPADGTVSYVGVQRGYGRLVKVRHANGIETVYAHLNRARVRVGDRVERGQRIADLGNTGRSTGPHLHYEVRLNGRPLNPMKFIRAANHVL
jgi:murein DD-endopeptidase MepM/ murein hydrolase activator NlpD